MKTSNYISLILLLLVGSTVSAQRKDSIIDRNVTIEREYKPVIQDAGKINSSPKTLEPTVEKTAPKYSDFNLPLNADFNIHTLPAAELQREKRRESKGGYARLGLGNYFNTLADFAYPIVKTPNMRLDVSMNHLATFGDKAHSTTKGALSFDSYFKTFDLYGGLGGGHEYLKYYGDNFNRDTTINLTATGNLYPLAYFTERNRAGIDSNPRIYNIKELANDSTDETFWRFNAYAGVRSLPLSKGIRYQAELQYKLFDSHNGLTENIIHTQAGFSGQSNNNRMGMDVELFNLTYSSNRANMLNTWDTYSVFAMNPYYSIERKNLDVRLGVKSSFSFVHGKPFNPSADIRAEFKAIPKYLSVYGGITGGYEVNSMNSIFAENRYLASDIRVNDTYTPYNFFAGIKVKPLYNLLLDAYVDYRHINNQYFFVNKQYHCTTLSGADSALYTNRFNVIYSAASHVKIGIRANYNLRNRVNVELKGAYNGWDVATETYAWNKPKWEADLSTDVHITRDWSINANVFVEGARYAKLGNIAMRMRPKVDINLGTSYSYNNWLTAFFKVNNLINNPYQNFYGYQVQGLNAMVGVAFSF